LRRGEGTWDEFLTRHAATLVQCDSLNKRIWTATGLREYFCIPQVHAGVNAAAPMIGLAFCSANTPAAMNAVAMSN
jgi:hypothetical protein